MAWDTIKFGSDNMEKYNLYRLIVCSILFGIALLPAVSNALDLTLVPRFQAGVMDYAFEQKPASYNNGAGGVTTNNGLKLVSVMPFVGGGVTLFANQFFVDFYLQKAFLASDTATNPFETDKGSTWDVIVDSGFDRDEYSVSVGYAIGSHWALFGGYRQAKTNFTDALAIPQGALVSKVNLQNYLQAASVVLHLNKMAFSLAVPMH